MTWQVDARRAMDLIQHDGDLTMQAHEIERDLAAIDDRYPLGRTVRNGVLVARSVATRAVHYRAIAPLCRLSVEQMRDDVRRYPIVHPQSGTLLPWAQRAISTGDDPSSWFGLLWRTWPRRIAFGARSAPRIVEALPGGVAYLHAAQLAVSALAKAERQIGTVMPHLANIEVDIAAQLTSGSTLTRKYSELVPRISAEHGIDDLAVVDAMLSDVSFAKSAAMVNGAHLEMLVRVWSGCVTGCYAERPHGSGHAQMLDHEYAGDATAFRLAHASAAWWDSSRWALYGTKPRPWPSIDVFKVRDPADGGKPWQGRSIGSLPVSSDLRCPATAFRAIELMTELMLEPIRTPQMLERASQWWADYVEKNNVATRHVQLTDPPPLAAPFSAGRGATAMGSIASEGTSVRSA